MDRWNSRTSIPDLGLAMTCRWPILQTGCRRVAPPKCPGCGRVMLVPAMRDPNPRVARKRKDREHLARMRAEEAELHGPAAPGVWRNPKFYFGVIVVLAAVGGAVFSGDRLGVKRQAEPRTGGRCGMWTSGRGVGALSVPHRRLSHAGAGAGRTRARSVTVPKWDGRTSTSSATTRGARRTSTAVREGPPKVFSCGRQTRGTPDDLHPDPARFDPGTEWTNGGSLPTSGCPLRF
jgi:hypothetical protein